MEDHLFSKLQECLSVHRDALQGLHNALDADADTIESMLAHIHAIKQSSRDFFTGLDRALSPSEQRLKEALHAASGNTDSAIRLYLTGTDAITKEDVLKSADTLFTLIDTGRDKAPLPDAAQALQQAADAAGIRLTISTPLPEDKDALRSFMKEASAALLKAARAGEKEVIL